MKKLFYFLLFLLTWNLNSAEILYQGKKQCAAEKIEKWNTEFEKLNDDKKSYVTQLIYYWIKLHFFKLDIEELEALYKEIDFENWKEEERDVFCYVSKNSELLASNDFYGSCYTEEIKGTKEEISKKLANIKTQLYQKHFQICLAFYTKAYDQLFDKKIKVGKNKDKQFIQPKEIKLGK